MTYPFGGLPCNAHGVFLPAGTCAQLPPARQKTDWVPFNSQVGFELVTLLFRDAELSRSKIDQLMELWTASMIEVGGVAPFESHKDLLHQIDQIRLSHILWHSFEAAYSGDQQLDSDSPLWMREKYEVWFHDPREIIHSILGNPDFSSGINYIPYHDFIDGKQRWSKFMSGDWAWDQAVRAFPCLLEMLSRI